MKSHNTRDCYLNDKNNQSNKTKDPSKYQTEHGKSLIISETRDTTHRCIELKALIGNNQ